MPNSAGMCYVTVIMQFIAMWGRLRDSAGNELDTDMTEYDLNQREILAEEFKLRLSKAHLDGIRKAAAATGQSVSKVVRASIIRTIEETAQRVRGASV